MTKLFAILSSFLILFQSFNISIDDISKLKVLLEHAEYHQETYGDTFMEFLVEHYSDDAILKSNNHKEHDSLPFKHDNHKCSHLNGTFTFRAITYNLDFTPFIAIPFNFFYKDSISFFEKPSVFQPPKLA
ncbi:hypothetical protein FF125_14855 [Aureibaculum algae]|uniref:Uncharacterized protein n=1 Tax=Aureibaculum algae TaxID=2584122 RepID=A0A5B7TWF0_9FLAO|nr:hypothetical protein [Aureibaculum algae]QCX39663.1 hypothetical protein FF125_14855 [Aureibaculum algae]